MVTLCRNRESRRTLQCFAHHINPLPTKRKKKPENATLHHDFTLVHACVYVHCWRMLLQHRAHGARIYSPWTVRPQAGQGVGFKHPCGDYERAMLYYHHPPREILILPLTFHSIVAFLAFASPALQGIYSTARIKPPWRPNSTHRRTSTQTGPLAKVRTNNNAKVLTSLQ